MFVIPRILLPLSKPSAYITHNATQPLRVSFYQTSMQLRLEPQKALRF